MKKEVDTNALINQRLQALKEQGADIGILKLLASSIQLQSKYLPVNSILKWLDEQLSKSGPQISPPHRKK